MEHEKYILDSQNLVEKLVSDWRFTQFGFIVCPSRGVQKYTEIKGLTTTFT